MIGQTISHYKIIEKLGEGGMGVVYKAHDTTLDRMVAMKFLPHYLTSDANEKERFYHEARAASALNHQNITTIYEIQEFNDQLYLAMELVEGKTLRRLIDDEPPALRKVLDIAIQVCDGLTAAHEKGVVHRDIKSDNIMVTPKGQVKIMDFGLAKVKGATKLTKAGSTLGTAAYMSPEQAQGADVDQRSDIFSFGVVLYELLTTKLPFRGEHQAAIMYSLINEEAQPVARFNDKVSAEIERIVSKAMAKDPEDRYQHCDDLLADLRRERKHMEYGRAGYATTSGLVQPAPAPAGPSPAAPSPVATSAAFPAQPAAAATSSQAPAAPRKQRLLKYGIAAGAVAAAVIAVLFFNPFNLQISTQKTAAASAKNSLAVMYFENIPDPSDKDHTGEMLTNLLTTSLFQTKDVEVISRERLYDLQKELGQGDQKSISPSLGTKIAQRAGVSMMLLGSILQQQPSLAVTYRLIDVQSGRILSTQRLSGFTPERVFSLVDTLALLVKNDLHVSPEGASAPASISKVTTSSPEAYRSYLEGVELNNRFYAQEATAAFRRAIELDSNFAMAYYQLAQLNSGGGPTVLSAEEIAAAINKAYTLRQNLTERERLSIQAFYASTVERNVPKAIGFLEDLLGKYPREQGGYLGLGLLYGFMAQYEKSTQTYQRGLQVDSLDKNLWNVLAYSYAGQNRKVDALTAIDRYLQLAPAEANPYDSKGDIYALFDDRDSAIVWWQKAISFRADFPSLEKLLLTCFVRQDRETAERYYHRFAASRQGEEKQFEEMLPAILLIQEGGLAKARVRFLEFLASHRKQHLHDWILNDLEFLIMLDYELGDFAAMAGAAKERSDELKKDPNHGELYGRMSVAVASLKNGDATAAARLANDVKEATAGSPPTTRAEYDYGMGVLSFEEGKYDRALEEFNTAIRAFPVNHAPLFPFALTLLKTGHRTEAIHELQRLTVWTPILNGAFDLDGLAMSESRMVNPVLARYWLGVAHDESGDKVQAVKELETFLGIWKGADFKSAEILDAQARLRKLKGTPAG